MTINSLDFVNNPWQFMCGQCMEIVDPNNLKTHLTKVHKIIPKKEAEPEYHNAMMNIYYFVVMPVSKFKENSLK